jgi:uncharacterized membrane protein YqiK
MDVPGATVMPLLGIVVVVAVGALVVITRCYRKVPQGTALIVGKARGVTVSFTSAVVLPVLHRAETMDLRTKRVRIERHGMDGLLCRDDVRADISITFSVRVNATAEDVLEVAWSIGAERASDEGALQELFSARFTEALKTVASRSDSTDLHADREGFRHQVVELVRGDALRGFLLEDAAIDYLERTPPDRPAEPGPVRQDTTDRALDQPH